MSESHLENLIQQKDVNLFLSKVEQIFPNFVAGVLCDNDGFPIASIIPQDFPVKEKNLALTAISNHKNFIKDTRYLRNYFKVKRDLDKSKNFKLYFLLERTSKTIYRFKHLKNLIENQSLF